MSVSSPDRLLGLRSSFIVGLGMDYEILQLLCSSPSAARGASERRRQWAKVSGFCPSLAS